MTATKYAASHHLLAGNSRIFVYLTRVLRCLRAAARSGKVADGREPVAKRDSYVPRCVTEG
jgi:hypothetical protein